MTIQELNNELGNIDIYLFDQILKGRYQSNDKILDAGCGEGRNIIYFMKNGYQVYGIDQNPSAIRMVQYLFTGINSLKLKDRFIIGSINSIPFSDNTFNAVICSAVLHFAENEDMFFTMFSELFRVIQSGGTIFIRMASNIGAEGRLPVSKDKKTFLPDGSYRFLLTREYLQILELKHQFTYLEPVKTVNVQDQRWMTTLVLQKK
jgi:tellurite methyltransferase